MKLNIPKQTIKQISWKEDNESVSTHIKSHSIIISKKDFSILMNGKFNIKGAKSIDEAKTKALSLLVD